MSNKSDAIYFIDPVPASVEIMHHDHHVFGAEDRLMFMDDVLTGDLIYILGWHRGLADASPSFLLGWFPWLLEGF